MGTMHAQAISALDSLIRWHVKQRTASTETTAQVIEDMPALVAVMQAEPGLTVPIAGVLLQLSASDEKDIICRTFLLASSPPLCDDDVVHSSPLISAREASDDRTEDSASPEAAHAPRDRPRCEGVEAIRKLLAHADAHSSTCVYDGAPVPQCFLEALEFAARCVLSLFSRAAAAEPTSGKAALVLQDLQQRGISLTTAQMALDMAGDRYVEIPTWLEVAEEGAVQAEDSDVGGDGSPDGQREYTCGDDLAVGPQMTTVREYFFKNGGRDIVRKLLQTNHVRAQSLVLRAVAIMTRLEGLCCRLLGSSCPGAADAERRATGSSSGVDVGSDDAGRFKSPHGHDDVLELVLAVAPNAADLPTQRADSHQEEFAHAVASCIGNFCACRHCRDRMIQLGPLRRLAEICSSFSNDVRVSRQVARAMHYLCMHDPSNPASSFGEWIRTTSAEGAANVQNASFVGEWIRNNLSCEDGFRTEWETVGINTLFELCAVRDSCVTSWIAKGMKHILKFVARHPAWSKYALQLFIQQDRPTLICNLLEHRSPLTTADAMEALAYLSGLDFHLSEANPAPWASKRKLYLSGCSQAVMAQGCKGLPCVSVYAAVVAANLAKDPQNLEDMMQGADGCFPFWEHLATQSPHRSWSSSAPSLQAADDPHDSESDARPPELAWTSLDGWRAAPGCGAYGWESDAHLRAHSRLLAIETLHQICSSENLHQAFVDRGGLSLLVRMASAERDEARDARCGVLVAQAIALVARGERSRWQAGGRPLLTGPQVKELKSAVKGFFSMDSDAIHKAAEMTLVLFNGLDGMAASIGGTTPAISASEPAEVPPGITRRPTAAENPPPPGPVHNTTHGAQENILQWPVLADHAADAATFELRRDALAPCKPFSMHETFCQSVSEGEGTGSYEESVGASSAATASSAPTSQIFESNLTEASDVGCRGGQDMFENSEKFRWQMGPCIGKGAFAEVYQGIHTITGKFVAVKQIKIKNKDSAAAKALQREIDVMAQLPHHRSVSQSPTQS